MKYPDESAGGWVARAGQGVLRLGASGRVRETLRGTDYALDDLQAAFAALWTVRRWVAGTARVFGDPRQRDSKGLAMRIVA